MNNAVATTNERAMEIAHQHEAPLSITELLNHVNLVQQVCEKVMKEGEHFLTFSDDLSDVSAEISKEQFEHVSENAYQLWKKWIKPDQYPTNTNLLQHIFDTIQTPRDT